MCAHHTSISALCSVLCHFVQLSVALLAAERWEASPQYLCQPAELTIRVSLHRGRCLIKAQVCISSSKTCWQNKRRQKRTLLSWLSEASQHRRKAAKPSMWTGSFLHSRPHCLGTDHRLKYTFKGHRRVLRCDTSLCRTKAEALSQHVAMEPYLQDA